MLQHRDHSALGTLHPTVVLLQDKHGRNKIKHPQASGSKILGLSPLQTSVVISFTTLLSGSLAVPAGVHACQQFSLQLALLGDVPCSLGLCMYTKTCKSICLLVEGPYMTHETQCCCLPQCLSQFCRHSHCLALSFGVWPAGTHTM